MHLILLAVSLLGAFICCYYSTSLVLLLNGETTTRRRKALFVALYPLVYQGFIYAFALTGVMHQVPYESQVIFTVTNPVLMFVFYFMLIKILGVSTHRSIATAVEIYLYSNITRMIARLIEHQFFRQSGPQFNYLYNVIAVAVNIALTVVLFYVIRHLLLRYNCVINAHENPPNKKMSLQLLQVFLMFCAIYLLCAVIPAFWPGFGTLEFLYTLTVLVVSMVLYVLLQAYTSRCEIIRNKEAHIAMLTRLNDESRELRHDFGNILQTYNGYLELGDWEQLRRYHKENLSRSRNLDSRVMLIGRMGQSPELSGLLLSKLEYAKRLNVNLEINLPARAQQACLPMHELCSCLSCLLDNAVEAAAESDARRAFLLFERAPSGSHLYIVTNSARDGMDVDQCLSPGSTTKPNHDGQGLPAIRRLLGKHANCSLRLSSYQGECSAYLEIQPN